MENPDPYVVNGKRYSLWPQFVERKAEWIGGTLEDLSCGARTMIVDIAFGANGKESAKFTVEGKDFTCECDVRFLAIAGNPVAGITFDTSFATAFRITPPEQQAHTE